MDGKEVEGQKENGENRRHGEEKWGSERRENMGIWKGLRGNTEGQSGDQIMKNLVPPPCLGIWT